MKITGCKGIIKRVRKAIQLSPESKGILQLLFKHFCEKGTLHGLRYFTVPVRHWSERLWWALAIGLALCLSFLMIHSFWVDWQNNPATLTTTKEKNPISKMPFPTVTICPADKVVRDKFDILSKFDSNYKLLGNLTQTDKSRILSLAQLCVRLVGQILYIDFADEDMFNIIEELAPTVELMALSCSWKGASIDCSEYLKPILTKYGLCFAFNGLSSRDIYTDEMAPATMISKSNPNVSHWSMDRGYEREFGEEEYPMRVNDLDLMPSLEIKLVSDKRNDNPYCPKSKKGFDVFLSPPFEQTTLLHRSIGVPLSQATHINFAPELTTTSNGLRKYSPTQRKCFFQSERQLRFFKTYSSDNCEMECWANRTNEMLGCVHFLMPRDKDTKICSSDKWFNVYEFAMRIDSMKVECNCLPACTSMNYDFELEQFPFDVTHGEKFNASQQHATLRITLQNYKAKTTQRVETVTVAEFLAVCGGILGLFMGFSALSPIEFIYYPTLRLFCMIQRMKEDNDEDDKDDKGDKDQSDQSQKNAKPSGTSNNNANLGNSRNGRLRNYLLEYCDNSSIHGLRYFSHPDLHRTDRRFWMICCVVSLSLCCWMTYNVWVQWQTSPVAIRFNKENDSRLTTPLPTITICPEVGKMEQKFGLAFALNNLSDLSDAETQRLNAMTNLCPLVPELLAVENKFANEVIYDRIHDDNAQFTDYVVCSWNNRTQPVSCSTSMTPILTDGGLCFAFNALNSHDMYTNEMTPEMMKVLHNWNVSGWNLENGYSFALENREYPSRLENLRGVSSLLTLRPFDKRNLEHQCKSFDGHFNLILTPPGEVMKMSHNSFRIHSGKINYISFETKVMTTSDGLRSYAPSQRRCFYQSERPLRFFKMYTQANCEEECLANFTSTECGCVHFLMPRDNKTKVCKGGASFACLQEAKRNLRTDESGMAFHSECNCLPGCVSIEYEVDIDRIPKDISYTRTSIVLNSIESGTSERVERFTVVDFLSSCGGLLGIFLGASVLSIIEIVYFATLRLFFAILQWKSENSVAPVILNDSLKWAQLRNTLNSIAEESVSINDVDNSERPRASDGQP